jgi:hypothetical protein
VNETTVNFTTSNSDLKVTFTGLNYDAVLFNGIDLNIFGSTFPGSGYFTIPFANGDTDTLVFYWGGDTHTLYLNPFDLNVGEVSNIDFNIYPNPTTDFLNITVDNYDGDFEVFDMSGKSLIKTTDRKIDVSYLNSGQYLLRLGTTTKIFIKN